LNLLLIELCDKVFHSPVSLDAVAGTAQKLKIGNVVSASLRSRNDVVDLKVTRLEVSATSIAVSALIAVESLAVVERTVERNPPMSVRFGMSVL